MNDDFDYYAAMESLYPDAEYVINKIAYNGTIKVGKELL